MRDTNRKNMIILFFTLVVVMMGFGMILPLLGFYVESFGAGGVALGLLTASYALMQFIFAPLWGQLSDRYGRKPILLIGILGNALTQLLFGLSTELWMLFAARALAGILSSATGPVAMAFIGDSTSEEQRSGGMGLMGAAMGVGMVLGPGLGGLLARDSLSLPFFVASALSVLALVLVVLLLPESLPEHDRKRETTLRGPQLAELWRALFGPIGVLLAMAFIVSFGLTNFEGVFSLYALERYGYGPQRVGLIMMFVGVTSALLQGLLTGPLSRRWGEANIIRASLLVSAVGFVAMTLARDFAGVVLTTLIFISGNALLRPSVSSLTSQLAPGGQGVAMGLNNAFMSLGRVFGPILAGLLLDVNLNLPYYSGAIVMAVGFGISMLWLRSAVAPHMPAAMEGSAAD